MLTPVPPLAFCVKIPCYRYGSIVALKDIDFTIKLGSLTAIIGPNGGGKSTLIKLMAGLHSPQSGEIVRPSLPLHNIAYLPQQHDLDRTFPLLVEEVVAMGLWPRRQVEAEKIPFFLKKAGLSGFEKRPLSALSGGEFQRLLFARLIAQKASIILLDEPFIGVDHATLTDLMALLHEWHGAGKTIVIILHDLNLVRAHFPQVLILSQKVIIQGDAAEVLTLENLARATFDV